MRCAAVILASLLAAPVCASVVTVTFDELNAIDGPLDPLLTAGYYGARNIRALSWTIGTGVAIYSNRWADGNRAIQPSSGTNYFTQYVWPGEFEAVAFEYQFLTPLTSFQFTRPGFAGSAEEPFIHPAWRLDAYRSTPQGRVLVGSIAAPAIVGSGVIAPQAFALQAEHIDRVFLVTDFRADATVPAVLVDDVVMTLVPSPGAAVLFAGGWLAAARRRRR
jgi:hypothetical protein